MLKQTPQRPTLPLVGWMMWLAAILLLLTPQVRALSETSALTALFPNAEMHNSYYTWQLDKCRIIALTSGDTGLVPLIFVHADNKNQALETAKRLQPLIYGEEDADAIIPFQGDEPTVALIRPHFFCGDTNFIWEKMRIRRGKSLLRTILYPALERGCTDVADLGKYLRFVGWSGTCLKVRNITPNVKAPTYEITVNIISRDVTSVGVRFFKNMPPSRQLSGMLHDIMFGHYKQINQHLPISTRTNLYTRLKCRAVLAFDEHEELGVIRRDKVHYIGEEDALSDAPGGSSDFPAITRSSTWPTEEMVDAIFPTATIPGKYATDETQTLLSLYPEAEKREGYYILYIGTCRVVVPFGLKTRVSASSSSKLTYSILPCVFVTGNSRDQALETAYEIHKNLFKGQRVAIVPFSNDTRSVAIIRDPYYQTSKWSDLAGSANLTRAAFFPALYGRPFKSPSGFYDRHEPYTESDLDTNPSFRFIGWEGTCLRVANSAPIMLEKTTIPRCELLINFAQPKLNYIGLLAEDEGNSTKDNIKLLCSAIFNIPKEEMSAMRSSFPGQEHDKLRRQFKCDNVWVYDPMQNFAIIYKEKMCYAGSIGALLRRDEATEKKDFGKTSKSAGGTQDNSSQNTPSVEILDTLPDISTPAEALRRYLDLLHSL